MAGKYSSSSKSDVAIDSDSDEDISVNDKCVYCQKEDIKLKPGFNLKASFLLGVLFNLIKMNPLNHKQKSTPN